MSGTLSKWIGPAVTILIAMGAFLSGYGSLTNQINGLVTKEEWRTGFIAWSEWRGGVDEALRNLEPQKARFGRDDFDREMRPVFNESARMRELLEKHEKHIGELRQDVTRIQYQMQSHEKEVR